MARGLSQLAAELIPLDSFAELLTVLTSILLAATPH